MVWFCSHSFSNSISCVLGHNSNKRMCNLARNWTQPFFHPWSQSSSVKSICHIIYCLCLPCLQNCGLSTINSAEGHLLSMRQYYTKRNCTQPKGILKLWLMKVTIAYKNFGVRTGTRIISNQWFQDHYKTSERIYVLIGKICCSRQQSFVITN